MSTLGLILLLTILSGVLSMIGGVILLGNQKLVKRFSIHFVSFAAGALLAGAFLDLLPEAVEMFEGDASTIFIYVLGSIVFFFLFERLLSVYHHHHYEDDGDHKHAAPTMLLIGDGIHNFVDGVVVAAAVLVNPGLGLVTALAVAAHELPQEISDFSIMLHHGWSRSKVFWSNLAVSLTAVVGGVLVFFTRDLIEPFLPFFLAVTAGIFIYISTSDLLPEISPETAKDKIGHVLALLLLGIAVVWFAGTINIGPV